MTTQVNGVEITPKMGDALENWYRDACSYDDTQPFYYVKWLSLIQDLLTRQWIRQDDNDAKFKECMDMIIQIKDALQQFIPDKDWNTNIDSDET